MELTKKNKTFIWGDGQDQVFKKMKALIISDTLLAYPKHNKLF